MLPTFNTIITERFGDMSGKSSRAPANGFGILQPTVQETSFKPMFSGLSAKLLATGRVLLLTSLVLSLLIAQPATAQESNPVCQDELDTLTNMIEGFVQLTTALGLIGLLVVWQADELTEMFTISQERTARLKEHKVNAMKSATVLVLLGPLFTIASNVMGLPIAQCVDLMPL